MTVGIVKWFNHVKGVGFITPDEGDEDVFVNATVIRAAGLQSLSEGQRVEFDAIRGDKGLLAQAVRSYP